MIIDFNKWEGLPPGAEYPFRLFDADGLEFRGYVVRVDLTTGDVWLLCHTPESMIIEYPEGESFKAHGKLKGPLKLVDRNGRAITGEDIQCDPCVIVQCP